MGTLCGRRWAQERRRRQADETFGQHMQDVSVSLERVRETGEKGSVQKKRREGSYKGRLG